MFTIHIKVTCNECHHTNEIEWDDLTKEAEMVVKEIAESWGWYVEPGLYHRCEDCAPCTCNCDCGCDADVDEDGLVCDKCDGNCPPFTCSCDCGCPNDVDFNMAICGDCDTDCGDEDEETEGYVCACDCGCDEAVTEENIRCDECIRLNEFNENTHILMDSTRR